MISRFDKVTVGKGMADLVLLPVEQYRRDGRVLRGLRKGTRSFLRAITVETLHTSHRVASFVARTLDDIVIQPGSRASLRGLEYYDEQPTGVLDSLEHAYDALAKEVQVRDERLVYSVFTTCNDRRFHSSHHNTTYFLCPFLLLYTCRKSQSVE